ncbi:Secreted RxLR effector peptide protein [Phytophthora palmivora]|uniref:Secreted RxLR effector peptide protein n=1 Tax=Phytophthora palmivora TaxID=4796 RepID=A0A2P4Y0W8_9STRA|nr:Secreted RxLR effector peptide protein [Phytophthora palmivora]
MKIFNKENPTKRTSVIETLTTHYGDEGLAKIIEAAKLVPATAGLAKRVQTEQIQRWLVAGETPESVYKLLKLDEAGQSLFEQPQIVTWAKYLDNFNKEHPESRMPLLSFLQARYKDEATLVQMLIAAEKVYSTKSLAVRIQAEQTNQWLRMEKVPADVFKLLKLDDIGFSLLENTLFSAWVNYMKLFNEQNPTEKTSVIATLTAHYGDDVLAKIIEAGKKVPSTEALAKRLQSEQMQHWLGKGKTPDDVFALLKLDKAGSELFAQPILARWVAYVDDFNNVNPDKKVTLFSTLASHYSDEVLTPMLIAAKKVPSTEKIAVEVQSVQTQLWLKAKKEPSEIFNYLQLNQEGYNIFSSPVFSAWVQYTDTYRKINYGTKLTTIDTLTKYYDDDVLTYMILEAFNSPSTVAMAKRLETEQLRNWYIQGKSPKDVFKALDLYSSGVTVFDNPLYPVWTKYTVYLGAAEPTYKENPAEKMSLLPTLTARFGDEAVATMLEAAKKNPKTSAIAKQVQDDQLHHWITTGKLPDDVFVLLKLNTVKTSLFDQPQLNTWVMYLDEFKKVNLDSQMTLYSSLATRYDEATLAKMLVVAKTIPSTESIAVRIQAEQTLFWIRTQKQPAAIFEMLKLNTLGTSFMHNPIFRAWVAYTDDFRKFYPGTHLTTIGTLKKYYTYDELVTVFIKASNNPSTASIAKRMETELLREWYFTATPVVDVFKLLNFPKVKMFESPRYTIWTNYIDYVKKIHPTSKIDELTLLTNIFTEEKLSAMLIAAERASSTKTIAKKLLNQQFDRWLAAKKDPKIVYFLWQVKTVTGNSLNTQLYREYVLAYSKL